MPVLLISEKYVKDNSFIDSNVDDRLITPVILLAQDKHVIPVTGSSLWNDILAQVSSGNISGDYRSLLDNYLQKAILWWTLAEAVLPLSYKLTNKNIVQKNSEFSQAAGMEDLLALKEQFVQNAEYYCERTIRHLHANPDVFPLYLQVSGNSLEAIIPSGTAYHTGMYLGIPRKEYEAIPFHERYQGKYGLNAGAEYIYYQE